jgi:hypothetical protein
VTTFTEWCKKHEVTDRERRELRIMLAFIRVRAVIQWLAKGGA